jgi:predicted transcriptional regulator
MSAEIPREIVIDEDEQKQRALEVFSDNYTRIILSTMMDRPKSVLQISTETKIPHTTVYRKIHVLLEHNLIRLSGEIAENGKKNFLYKSKIKSFHMTFTKDRFAILVNASGTCKFCLQSHV